MKVFKKYKQSVLLTSFMFCINLTFAQKLSIDGAVIRNTTLDLKGINTAAFFHFTEKFSGGLELTRFYTRHIGIKSEGIERSAWDIDLNFHYDIFRFRQLVLYPITGVGYNEVRENNRQLHESVYERYWAVNTGAGIRLDGWILQPHAEYTTAWVNRFEHIFLAGISIEIGKKKIK